MVKVLFLNHNAKQCGVYQYGYRLYNILKTSSTVQYKYYEIGTLIDYVTVVKENPDIRAIIYNYHTSTMPWLRASIIQHKVKNVGIPHESPSSLFDITLSIDDSMPESITNYYLPRPLYEDVDKLLSASSSMTPVPVLEFINAHQADAHASPIFGSFGFGFQFKGFHNIVKLVNEKYDSAVIKFVVPVAHFDSRGSKTNEILYNACVAENKKPGIKLMITHDFFSNEDILRFLKSNTVNIFMYDNLNNRSISSVIDYALSVKRPLVISNSHMFRHIYDDSICVLKSPFQQCIDNSVSYCAKFLELYSNARMISKVNDMIVNNCNIQPIQQHPASLSSNSQASQDIFVARMTGYKRDGRFLEIGSNHPVTTNNTYMLESCLGWSGLLVEYDKRFEPMYQTKRPASQYIINDARRIDYANALESYPQSMDYLQIDLDADNRSTLDVLELLDRTVFQRHKFATVTFETDIYRGDFFNTRAMSREIFKSHGYQLIFPDVKVFWEGDYKPFEDWYVHPDLVNPELITKYKTEESLTCDEIKSMLLEQS